MQMMNTVLHPYPNLGTPHSDAEVRKMLKAGKIESAGVARVYREVEAKAKAPVSPVPDEPEKLEPATADLEDKHAEDKQVYETRDMKAAAPPRRRPGRPRKTAPKTD